MIELSHVRKTYNRSSSSPVRAIDDTTLSFPETGMVAIFGKSGCGKTTLLNVIGGLDKYDSGDVRIDGAPVGPDCTKLRNRAVGYIFQNYNLNESKTVFENVADALRLCGMEDAGEIETRVLSALSVVGLEKFRKRLPSTLSGGQQQRVAIARAIVKAPRVILADEPTGNLDDSNTVMVMSLLKKLSRTCLILLVTHEADLVDAFCDQVIEIVDGRVHSERSNEATEGVVRENRSDIYLGDLSGSDGEIGGIRLTAYTDGSSSEPLVLRVVTKNGTIFLDTGNDARVRILNAGSEVRLLEGTREDALRRLEAERAADQADVSALTPFEGRRFGRMYTFGAAVRSAFQALFRRSQKKGRKFLNILLVVFAVLMVGQAAQFGTVIREFRKTRSAYSDDSVFVSLPYEGSNAAMDALVALEGVDTAFLTDSTTGLVRDLTFTIASFETYSDTSWYPTGPEARGIPIDVKYASDLKVVAGRNTLSSDSGMIITTAVADQLMESGAFSFLRSREDLIDLMTKLTQTRSVHIEGIVESSSNLFFLSPKTMVDLLIDTKASSYIDLDSTDSFDMEHTVIQFTEEELTELPKGSVLVNTFTGFYPESDRTVLIFGREFEIAGFFGPEIDKTDDPDQFVDYTEYPDIVFHPDDYASLLFSVGSSDWRLGGWDPKYYDSQSETNLYAVLFTTQPRALADRVRESGVGYREVLTGSEMFWRDYGSDFQGETASRVIVIAVFLIIMCLCVFLIMRANMMSQVREIGICRAIGTSKRNLVFKYWIETLMLLSSTMLIGFVFSSALYGFIGSQPLIGTMVYYPVWLALAVLILLYGVGCLCGLIPVWTILKKTPCQILSKYDI